MSHDKPFVMSLFVMSLFAVITEVMAYSPDFSYFHFLKVNVNLFWLVAKRSNQE